MAAERTDVYLRRAKIAVVVFKNCDVMFKPASRIFIDLLVAMILIRGEASANNNLRRPSETGTTPIPMSYCGVQKLCHGGNRVFQADNFVAMAAAFDAHGRRIAELYQDGTKKIIDHDAWGRANELTAYDSGGTTVTAHTKLDIQPAGDLKSLETDVETGLSRSADFLWDGGGRTTYTGVKPSIAGTSAGDNRAAHQVFDAASRLVSAQSGAGSGGAVIDSFTTTQVTSYMNGTSDLAAAIKTVEPASSGTLEMFTIVKYGLAVPTVRDYTRKIKILDGLFEIAPAEKASRDKEYSEYLNQQHARTKGRS